jgi:hypothetical protein
MTKFRNPDDGTIKCTNRLLMLIFIAIALQTILVVGLAVGLYIAYDNHKDTFHELGAVPWGNMAQDLKSQYMNMDKDAVNEIISNSKNLTQKANLLVHMHADTVATDVNILTKKAVQNTDLIDVVRTMLYDMKKPINELVQLIDRKNTIDIQSIREMLLKFTSKLDAMQLNRLLGLVETLLKHLEESLTPETFKEIGDIIDKIDGFMNNENSKLVHDLAEDADHSVKSINKLFSLFENVNKRI